MSRQLIGIRTMAEDTTPKGTRLRSAWKWGEDMRMLRAGILDWRSLKEAHKFQKNPVEVLVHRPIKNIKAGMSYLLDHAKPGYGIIQVAYTHNLRTNLGADWQARAMAGGGTTTNNAQGFSQGTPSTNVAITAPTGTTAGKVTDTNASITTATAALNQFVGCLIVYANGTAAIAKIGHVVGNSASAASSVICFFDNWFDLADASTTVAAPSANQAYSIIPASPAYYIGLTTTAITPAAADTTLTAEITDANGLTRAYYGNAGYTHATSGTLYKLQKTLSATGTYTNVQGCGMFTGKTFPNDAASDLSAVGKGGGLMVFENTFTSVNLLSGDQLTPIWTVNY